MRSLERELSKICRKVVKALQLKQMTPQIKVTSENLNEFLGVRKFTYGRAEQQNQVGQVVGLAWTGSRRGSADDRGRDDARQGARCSAPANWAK